MQFERRGPPHPGPLPKEREPSLTDPRNLLHGSLAFDCEMVSLSLRESAGVRGRSGPTASLRLKAGLRISEHSKVGWRRNAPFRSSVTSIALSPRWIFPTI